MTTLWTASDWAKFGEVQGAVMGDSDVQALMVERHADQQVEHVRQSDDRRRVTTHLVVTTEKVPPDPWAALLVHACRTRRRRRACQHGVKREWSLSDALICPIGVLRSRVMRRGRMCDTHRLGRSALPVPTPTCRHWSMVEYWLPYRGTSRRRIGDCVVPRGGRGTAIEALVIGIRSAYATLGSASVRLRRIPSST